MSFLVSNAAGTIDQYSNAIIVTNIIPTITSMIITSSGTACTLTYGVNGAYNCPIGVTLTLSIIGTSFYTNFASLVTVGSIGTSGSIGTFGSISPLIGAIDSSVTTTGMIYVKLTGGIIDTGPYAITISTSGGISLSTGVFTISYYSGTQPLLPTLNVPMITVSSGCTIISTGLGQYQCNSNSIVTVTLTGTNFITMPKAYVTVAKTSK